MSLEERLSRCIIPMKEELEKFGDGICGEPLIAQHLVLDFTPSNEEDTSFLEKKCCTFWDFVRTKPELQDMVVLPVKYIKSGRGSFSPASCTVSPPTSPCDRTALSVLNLLEEGNGLIECAFETRLPAHSLYSVGSGGHSASEQGSAIIATHCRSSPYTKKSVSKSSGSSSIRRRNQRNGNSSPKLSKLCQNMHDWDCDHPKSMEPPAHPPDLEHCVMQRSAT